MTNQPPTRTSDEADAAQLALAREQGQAYERALREMVQGEAHGDEQRAGDYIVSWAAEEAEGMYRPGDGELEWQDPTEENAHLEIAVRDAADGRFIPGLEISLTVIDTNGDEVGTHRQPFLWHPWLYHYGRNWKLPGDGRYDLVVRIDPPEFGRHDRTNGRRYAEPVEVRFDGIELETGRKHSTVH